ncbi:hybrid sensor histidine kinase/response regulator [Candidatus Laterigemmans baculatus]|uniref:hybrid sensor histidine kinase/response regulator n=1 Tax=Candidatus Laterigemmans baculatus TaxID=2770505 RepID=UPI0013D8E128|nr:PAS domain S-box protein [Candidatus Laterigemmans baculatus]
MNSQPLSNPRPVPSSSRAAMPHVLIVDDNAEQIYMLGSLLRGHGFGVEEASDGAEALTLAQRRPPDLIISDLLMPVLDGYGLLQQWKEDERLRWVPFVVYTATYTDPQDQRLAVELGADAFLIKPIEPKLLVECVAQITAGSYRAKQPAQQSRSEEAANLKAYNETLVRKLEKRNQHLEQINQELLQEIAQRERTEAAFHESEERYRKLFNAIVDPLFVYDLETRRFLAVNDAAIDGYGYSRDEFLAMSVTDLRPAEDVPAFLKMLERPMREGAKRGVWRHRKKGGSIIDVDVTSSGIELDGRTARVVQARDVTEKRRAEAAAARATELLQGVLQGTPDAIYVKDRDGRYLLFSQAAADYAGKPVEDVLGRDDTEVFDAEGARVVMASDRLVLSSNAIQTVEEQVLTPLGPRTFQAVKVPYRDPDGNVIGLIGVSRDITAQKEAEAALRLRDRAIQSVSQGILITDPTQEDNPIVFASEGFERMTGYRAEEVLGKNRRFLRGKDTNPETAQVIESAFREGRGCSVEILNYRKDGTPFWDQVVVSPILDADGHLANYVVVQTDVTARRKLEEQFRQAQKMEAVGQLAGGVAHDFNNLLTVINGYSDLLRSEVAADDPRAEMLLEIHKAGERAGKLTRQLLTFSRRQVLETKRLNLNEIVADTEKMLRRLIGEDILLQTELCPELENVQADPGQMEQVLLNLAVNARDAMPQGGTLTIRTQMIRSGDLAWSELDGSSASDHAMVEVRDTGCGMDEETRKRVFEPFFTTKAIGKGTGLGLATLHGIVKQSGGSVAVESVLGQGTAFRVYLPVVAELESTGAAEKTSFSLPRGNETVLLVEDESPVRDLASRILRGCGYRVLEASHGEEALAIANDFPGVLQLLISDVVMPHLGGRALAEQLSASRPDCKILFLSGYTDDAVIRHGVLQDAFAFLQKPFTPASLAQKVRCVLDAAK